MGVYDRNTPFGTVLVVIPRVNWRKHDEVIIKGDI